ncbi:hypothetical protein NPIL_9281 [Nephila pilipes]|uniref:Uncharacterized protein n=1 Tax=Nephila pilipes TaxID=299642 RepID=A0A8X6N8P8_NEPPI|nr:hypothetical protein NPIL_9281 [Nephila pilipes]
MSPCHYRLKPTGLIRWTPCRKLNVVSKLDAGAIPRIDAIFDKLAYPKNFDLYSEYWHIELENNEVEKLSITLNCGLFQSNRPLDIKTVRQYSKDYHAYWK